MNFWPFHRAARMDAAQVKIAATPAAQPPEVKPVFGLLATLLPLGLKAIPYVVAGIEMLHAELPGASKKKLALDALGVAETTAAAVLPQADGTAITTSYQAVSDAIDGVVSIANAQGVFKKAQAATQTAATGVNDVAAAINAAKSLAAPQPVL